MKDKGIPNLKKRSFYNVQNRKVLNSKEREALLNAKQKQERPEDEVNSSPIQSSMSIKDQTISPKSFK